MRLFSLILISFVFGGAAACGDDPGPGTDAGVQPGDAGEDSRIPDARPDAEPLPDMCPGGDCIVSDGSGCAEGEACYFLSAEEGAAAMPMCQPAGAGEDGAACMSYADCAGGYYCDLGTDGGQCRQICCGDSDELCPEGQSCQVRIVDGEGRPTGVGLCRASDSCDPLTQMGCSDGQGCYPNEGGTVCTRPVSGMGLLAGEACVSANDCAPGLTCAASAGAPSSCVPFCRLPEGEPDCPEGQVCGTLTGFTDFGVCVSGG